MFTDRVTKEHVLKHSNLGGAPIAQLGERQTLDCKVAGLILTRAAVMCP